MGMGNNQEQVMHYNGGTATEGKENKIDLKQVKKLGLAENSGMEQLQPTPPPPPPPSQFVGNFASFFEILQVLSQSYVKFTCSIFLTFF